MLINAVRYLLLFRVSSWPLHVVSWIISVTITSQRSTKSHKILPKNTNYLDGRTILHCFQEDIFQRISFIRQTPNLHLVLQRQVIEIANLRLLLKDYFQAVIAGYGALASQPGHRRDKFS